MNKIDIRQNFSRLMQAKYQLKKEVVDGYLANKDKEEKYQNKKNIIASIGAVELLGTTAFGVYDFLYSTDSNNAILIGALSAVAVMTTTVALVKSNPYTKKEYKLFDSEYKVLKRKLKDRDRKEKKC